jgi:hypothetical protein
MNEDLPVYQRKATPTEQVEQHAWMEYQMANLNSQEEIGVPAQFVKIRCGCNKYVPWREMYRCLYCGIWFCTECAEQHYGMRRAP